jgi:hypothetical protein
MRSNRATDSVAKPRQPRPGLLGHLSPGNPLKNGLHPASYNEPISGVQEMIGDDGESLIPPCPPDQLTKFLPHRLVERAGKRPVETMNGNQFDHVCKVPVRSAQVTQPASNLGLY